LDIRSIVKQAAEFEKHIRRVKQSLGDTGFPWYPYNTMSGFSHLEKLLAGPHRDLFNGKGRLLDLGSQDGEAAFFMESLGYKVVAVDHPAYNHNGMRGIRALKTALNSSIEIHEIDIDRPFTLPYDTYDLVIFLGVLYHLRNPFYVLEELARRTRQCLVSTRVARRLPDGSAMPPEFALAYLLRDGELNKDDTNYFIFSEQGLRVMLDRAHWNVQNLLALGDTKTSDPVSLDRDERVFSLLESRYEHLGELELLGGWYESEETGWRWTRGAFGVRLPAAAGRRVLTMKLWVADESIQRLGPITLSGTANGTPLEPAVYETVGLGTYVRELDLSAGGVELQFRVDKVLEPDDVDDRERGIVVASLQVA
jgi:tRNA (mo5U34)-methyltransferase